MSRSSRFLTGATLAISGLIVGIAFSLPSMAMILPLLGLLTSAISRRFDVSRLAEVAHVVASFALSTTLALLLIPQEATWYSGRLTPPFGILALGSFLVAAVRILLVAPYGGYVVTAGLSLIAVLGASTAQLGPLFPLLGGVYLLSQIIALNWNDARRQGWAKMTETHHRSIIVGIGAASLTSVAFALILPPAYDFGIYRFGLEFLRSRSGFSTNLSLDGLGGMIQSDEAVLRVYGAKTDHLRGVVYSKYVRGRWVTSRDSIELPVPTDISSGDVESGGVEIRSIGGSLKRYFVPLHAEKLQVEGGRGRSDDTGVIFPEKGEDAERVRFIPGRRDRFEPASPSEHDLDVPESILAHLSDVADRWAGDRGSPRAKLEALKERFHEDFEYSLSFRHRRRVDPIIDFLDRRTGHCEYFASTLALLARTLGIPSRVVAGYRVTELNSFGGYYLVRERNAHAWVEAWIQGEGWVTFDPTPPAALSTSMNDQTPWFAAIVDTASASLAQLYLWLQERSLIELAIAVAALLALWLGIRLLRRRRTLGLEDSNAGSLVYREPGEALVRLLDTLSMMGESRPSSMPLEGFARQIRISEKLALDRREVAATLIARYSAWRFGGEGEVAEIDAAIEGWLEEE